MCAARHLSRPAMSPSSPFRITNIVHTLQLDWWRLFFYGWVVGWGWAVTAEVQRKGPSKDVCVLRKWPLGVCVWTLN